MARCKITDFGIARLDTSNLTMEGQLLGTPNYMAPEQIQGKEVDHRADIFSLGVVFYEMLTRRKPFQGENLTAVTHKIVYEPFTPAEEIIKDLPPGLTAIMSRCLEKDPNRRYPRAAEIAAELRRSGSNPSEALADDDDDTSATQEVAEETVDQTAPRPPEADAQVPGWPAPSPKSAASAAGIATVAGRRRCGGCADRPAPARLPGRDRTSCRGGVARSGYRRRVRWLPARPRRPLLRRSRRPRRRRRPRRP